jgi:hypothetical protein
MESNFRTVGVERGPQILKKITQKFGRFCTPRTVIFVHEALKPAHNKSFGPLPNKV